MEYQDMVDGIRNPTIKRILNKMIENSEKKLHKKHKILVLSRGAALGRSKTKEILQKRN